MKMTADSIRAAAAATGNQCTTHPAFTADNCPGCARVGSMKTWTVEELQEALEMNMSIDRDLATPTDDALLLALRGELARRENA